MTVDIDIVRRRFGATAEAYAKCKVQSNDYTLTRLVELLHPLADWNMVDVACGAGHTSIRLAPLVANVLATDVTKEMLEQTDALADSYDISNIQTKQSEASEIPAESASIDLVTCRLAVHHFSDPITFWREAHRVLRPGGLLAVIDSHLPNNTALEEVNKIQKLHDPSHAACLTRQDIEEKFHQSGFALRDVEEGEIRLGFKTWTQRVNLSEKTINEIRLRMVDRASTSTSELLKIQEDADEEFTFSFQRIIAIGEKK